MNARFLLGFAGVTFAAALLYPSAPSIQVHAQSGGNPVINPNAYQDLRWRSVGPHRGGRSTAAAGVRTQPNVFYMGATGGGVWKTENYGITWLPVTDGQIPTGSIGAIDVADSNPNVVYVGTGSEAIRSNVILGRGVFKSTDAGQDVAVGRSERSRANRPAEDPSEESRHRVRRGDRQSVRLGTGSRRLPHEGRRQDVAEGAVHQRSDRRRVDRDQLGRTRTRSTPAPGARSASRGRSSAAARRRKAASTRRPTAAITGAATSNGFPDDLSARCGWTSRSRTRKSSTRRSKQKARRADCIAAATAASTWAVVNSIAVAARAAVLLQQGLRQPEGRERRLGRRS